MSIASRFPRSVSHWIMSEKHSAQCTHWQIKFETDGINLFVERFGKLSLPPNLDSLPFVTYWPLISSASSMTTLVLPFGFIRSREPFIRAIRRSSLSIPSWHLAAQRFQERES